jgi:leucyl-tRNA synthetase
VKISEICAEKCIKPSEWDEAIDYYLRMMAPACPHITEELWVRLGKPYSIHQQAWPVLDEDAAAEDMITLVIQINGKVRDRIQVQSGITKEQLKILALENAVVQKHLEGGHPKKVIVVPGRLVNIVV